MLLNRLAQCWKIKNNEGCHRRVLASCPRPRRLLGARSHVDSHDLASDSESATAGQSVRRVQAPTGHSARWHQTVSEVFSTGPRSPGTLGAQRHARADRITSHSRHTVGRHHTEGDQARVLLTHTNADRARGVTVAVRASVRACRLHAADVPPLHHGYKTTTSPAASTDAFQIYLRHSHHSAGTPLFGEKGRPLEVLLTVSRTESSRRSMIWTCQRRIPVLSLSCPAPSVSDGH